MGNINFEQLKDKYILLDTCFIAKAYQYIKFDYLDELFLNFKKINASQIINKFIKFEFFRGCKNLEHVKLKQELLNRIAEDYLLPPGDEMFEVATNISMIYSNKNIQSNQINTVDCLLSAYLQKYGPNIILLTENHKDFPPLLHNRIGVYTIDAENDISVLGFYTFKQKEYLEYVEDLKKSQVSID